MSHDQSTIFPSLAQSPERCTGLSWDGLLAIEQHRVPPGEFAECRPRTHVVTLHLSPACPTEWWVDGEMLSAVTVAKNQLSLVSEGTRLGWRRCAEAEELHAGLDPAFVRGIAGRGDVEFRNLLTFENPGITHIMRTLRVELRQNCPTGRLYVESLATALALKLLHSYSVHPVRIAGHRGGLPPARLRRVLEYIESHLDEDTSLRQLGVVAELSPHHFATQFQQATGLPPHRYVLRRRAERAKELLADPERSLADIAYALGYSSQAHFTTMFRKLVGLAPGAYRNATGIISAPDDVVFSGRTRNSHEKAKAAER